MTTTKSDYIGIAADPATLDAILAALRAWQIVLSAGAAGLAVAGSRRLRELHDIANEHGYELSPEDIDELCEALNCNGVRLTARPEHGAMAIEGPMGV